MKFVASGPEVSQLDALERTTTVTDGALAPLPTLEDLARNLEAVADVPLSAIPSLMTQTAALQAALATRLATASITPGGPARERAPESERLLTPHEAAALLGMTVTWLYRHAGRLPFARRLSRKALRFSEAGFQRWLATRKP
jgi:predicted DNA-binding transcriptional regulator AlpA